MPLGGLYVYKMERGDIDKAIVRKRTIILMLNEAPLKQGVFACLYICKYVCLYLISMSMGVHRNNKEDHPEGQAA
uniref:Uncharacterized protein n=1 Tax=Rhizophora mucronata TaxID=61149 RepID=A0A2P2P7I4_RHIMU